MVAALVSVCSLQPMHGQYNRDLSPTYTLQLRHNFSCNKVAQNRSAFYPCNFVAWSTIPIYICGSCVCCVQPLSRATTVLLILFLSVCLNFLGEPPEGDWGDDGRRENPVSGVSEAAQEAQEGRRPLSLSLDSHHSLPQSGLPPQLWRVLLPCEWGSIHYYLREEGGRGFDGFYPGIEQWTEGEGGMGF